MAAPVKQIGYLALKSRDALASDYVPIYSLDAIRLRRSQDYSTTVLGPQSAYVSVWRGSQPMTYDINFDLMIGWGEIRSAQDLKEKVAVFHAMCSHQLQDDKVLPPAPVQLLIAGYVDMVGYLEDIGTELKPPWIVSTDLAGTKLTGTSCTFTGKFRFAPGLSASGLVSTSDGNKAMSSTQVGMRLYISA